MEHPISSSQTFGRSGISLIFMRIPIITCAGCRQRTVIPYKTFVNSSVIEPYWPEESESLPWVCDRCSRLTVFSRNEIEQTTLQEHIVVPSNRGFWRVEIPCKVLKCSASITAYTQTFGKTLRFQIGKQIANSSPGLTCSLGHGPSPKPYPSNLDFVEWSGGKSYLM